jgi:2-polyprenyl-6-hydroxyphenyl methylase/3-demethylubiquinone-9 3-methyltransferase
MAGFFAQFSQSWANPMGPMVFLHRMQGARMAFIRKALASQGPLMGLDLGSGVGMVSAELAMLGHVIDSVEREPDLITKAQELHKEQSASISWITCEAESFVPSQSYDFIVCLEMLEHVADPENLCKKMVSWLKPSGHLILSTINRTNSAYIATILGAEYLFKILPVGTHAFEKFLKPEEINHYTDPLICQKIQGLIYNPLEKIFFLGQSLCINYIGHWKNIDK